MRPLTESDHHVPLGQGDGKVNKGLTRRVSRSEVEENQQIGEKGYTHTEYPGKYDHL